MRVISGSAARRKLYTPEGMDVRPTTDRIKETLFNILAPDIADTEFLDLFSGSGQIGIEAISRGAKKAVFVDNSSISIGCLKKNLDITGFNDKAEVLRMDAASAVGRLASSGKKFDIIFMDPPYEKGIEEEVIYAIGRTGIMKEDGMIIVEASSRTGFDYIDETPFEITREKKYGSNKHLFIAYK